MLQIFRFTILVWMVSGFSGLAAQIIDSADILITEAPDLHQVCTYEPTDYNANKVIAHNDILGKSPSAKRSSDFNVTYVSACGGETWPAEALSAFEYAMSIWETHLESEVPVRIEAIWEELDANVLGSAGPTRIAQIPPIGEENTWYSIAQASAMTGEDIVGSTAGVDYDIIISINCDFNAWYFGQDENPPLNMIDFVTVVLHEIGHGIGFIGSMSADEDLSIADWGFENSNGIPQPIIFDLFTRDGDEISLIDETSYENPSTTLYDALVGDYDGVFFDGVDANIVNVGQAVQLYAPFPWQGGSSYSHLDQDTFGQSDNSLMRPRLDRQFSIHTPGPVMCGMLSDMGWPLGQNCFDLLGVDSEISITQNLFNYGVNNVGETEQLTLTIHNESSATEQLSGSIIIENANFAIPSPNQSFEIAPGESVEIPVIYDPQNVDEHSGELTVVHNSLGIQNPIRIPLNGEALEEARTFVLDQNFPNPFNAQTRIEYALTGTSNVLLEVYNTSGQLVSTLQDGEQSEGRYEYDFNAGQFSSGLYLYRIIVDGRADTKKLLLVK